MSTGKEIVAIALALIGWIVAVVACFLPMWKVSAVTEAGTGRAQTIWEGLWMNCVTKSTEKMQCTAYNSTQAITSDLQAARDMTVIAIITALLPLTLSFMGAKCTNCIKDKALKVKVLIVSGVFFIISGCLVLISVSWTINTPIQDHRMSSTPHTDLEASLSMGFAAAALLIIGGVMLCCTCTSWRRSTRTSKSRHHSKGMKIVGIVQALIGWILTIVTCVLPKWKVSAFPGANIVTAQIFWEGIWMSCVVQSTGQMQWQCKVYESMLALSSDLQAARAMTVISIITALLALALSIMGLKSTTCIKGKTSKTGILITSGVFFIIAGILVLISVSWTTNTIIQDFYNPMVPSSQCGELGAALYIGFTAAALLIFGGSLLCCPCVTQKK
ncbi:hypothetical protein AOLI_G00155930 [Acnodon oligacanthus]